MVRPASNRNDRDQSSQPERIDQHGSGSRWSLARIARDVIRLSLFPAALDASTKRRARASTATGATVSAIAGIDLVTPEKAYAFWRDFQNLPLFMSRLVSIDSFDTERSRWRAQGPAGMLMEWETAIVEDRPNECLRWHSLPGAPVGHRAEVYFRPAPEGRGTEVLFQVEYELPAGKLGGWLASLTGHALGVFVQNDLHRFKKVLEVGGVLSSGASPNRQLRTGTPRAR